MNVRALFLTNLVLAGAMIGFALWVAAGLEPAAELPIHWDAAGEADRFAPAMVALLMPAGISLLLAVTFSAVPRLEPLQDRLEASAPLLRSVWIGMMLLMAYVQVMIAAPGLGWNLGPDLLLVGLGALMVMIGDSLPKSRPNFFVGIRTPWAIGDTDNWIATHRLGGKITMAAGCILMLAAFAPLSPGLRAASVMTVVGAAVLVPIIYSWRLWNKRLG